jgi:hypothetical protein
MKTPAQSTLSTGRWSCSISSGLRHRRGFMPIRYFCLRAPLSVHDVVQVVVTPFSHLMQACTH